VPEEIPMIRVLELAALAYALSVPMLVVGIGLTCRRSA
jgi:hypothetical protein